jgi:hypothetical protein
MSHHRRSQERIPPFLLVWLQRGIFLLTRLLRCLMVRRREDTERWKLGFLNLCFILLFLLPALCSI